MYTFRCTLKENCTHSNSINGWYNISHAPDKDLKILLTFPAKYQVCTPSFMCACLLWLKICNFVAYYSLSSFVTMFHTLVPLTPTIANILEVSVSSMCKLDRHSSPLLWNISWSWTSWCWVKISNIYHANIAWKCFQLYQLF